MFIIQSADLKDGFQSEESKVYIMINTENNSD